MLVQITAQGVSSEFSSEPLWRPVAKLAAKCLAPYLESLDQRQTVA
jgi:hypothetical protein